MSLRLGESWKSEVSCLLTSVKKGYTSSFSQLHTKTSAELFRLVFNIVRDESSAADVLQEAYLKVWIHIDQFDSSSGCAWGWLCQIFRNKAIDYYRQQQRLKAYSVDVYEREPYQENTLEWENDIYLKRLFRSLKLEEEQALVSAYIYGYSHQEVATKFEAPIGTVKSRIRRGMVHLQERSVYLQ